MARFRTEHLADGITVYRGDCRDVLAELPDESVNMIWTDPPYGNNNGTGDLQSVIASGTLGFSRGHAKVRPIANDDAGGMRVVVDAMLTEAARILDEKSACLVCCSGGGGPNGPSFAWLANRLEERGLRFFHSVIWDKKNGLGWRYRRHYEMVMVGVLRGGKLAWASKKAVPNIIRMSPPAGIKRLHPNEKPVALVEHFIELHTKRRQLVVDPFMGGGTTGVAAVNLKRRFIGVELDRKYFDVACKRIDAALRAREEKMAA